MDIKSVVDIPLEKMEELSQLSADCYSSNFHEGFDNWASKVLARKTLSMYAEEDGKLIGYIIAFPYNSGLEVPLKGKIKENIEEDCIYIHDLGVKKEYRDRGIAKRLINTVLHKASKSGLKICLISVQDTVRFWEKNGFRMISEKTYGGETSYWMEKQ